MRLPTTPSSAIPAYRPDIDGLRAVAVLLVLVFHAFPGAAPGGFIGVDVFFVISGYLISGILLAKIDDGSFSYADFYSRRLRRIAPSLLIVMLAVLVFGWLVLLPQEYARLRMEAIASALFAANIQFFSETGYFDTAAPTKPLLHLWSLGIEEQFYLIWPVALLLFRFLRIKVIYAAILIVAVSFAVNVASVSSHQAAAFYLPTSRLWELAIGALLVGRSASNAVVAHTASVAGTLLIAIGAAMTPVANFPGWWALPSTLGAALLIWAGASAWINRFALSSQVLVAIGLVSYPLYLWHWPLLSFGQILAGATPASGFRAGALVASVLLAWLTYRAVETPIRRSRIWAVPVALASALAVVAAVAVLAGNIPQPEITQGGDPATIHIGAGGEWVVAGCGVSEEEQKQIRDCYTDRRDTPIYAIWGDSHATALLPGLLRESRPGERWLDVGAGGCPPMNGTHRVFPGDPGYNTPVICAATNKVALSMLTTAPQIRAVVFVAASRMVELPIYGKDGESVASPDGIIDGMSEAAHTVHEAGKAVYILVDNPILPDPRDCLQRVISVPSDDRRPCEITLAEHRQKTTRYREILAEIKRRDPYVVFIDPTPLLCPNRYLPGPDRPQVSLYGRRSFVRYGQRHRRSLPDRQDAQRVLMAEAASPIRSKPPGRTPSITVANSV